jgi:DNA gyrase subunit A
MAGLEVIEEDADLLVVTEKGYGKRTVLTEYPVKSRGGQGIATINQSALEKIGPIAVARVVKEQDGLTLISAGGVVLRLHAEKIARSGRSTRGSHIMNLEEGDLVASMARLSAGILNGVPKDSDVPVEGMGNP